MRNSNSTAHLENSGSHRGRIVLIGAGNILKRDDGVGVETMKRLQAREFPTPIEFIDAGTAIQDVLPQVAEAEAVVIVDALEVDEQPGSLFRLTPEELRDCLGQPECLSLHQVSLLESIQLVELTGRRVPPVTIYGVVPAEVGLGLGLSDMLEERLTKIVQTIYDDVCRIGKNMSRDCAAGVCCSTN